MALFEEKIRQQLASILSQMKDGITMVYFTQEIECASCKDAHMFVEEIASLDDKITLNTYDFVADKDKAAAFGVDKVPAILLLDKDGKDPGIRFYGVPGGYEINSFLGAILEVSGKSEPLPVDIAERVARIDKDIHLQVFVSLGCPHCPGAVATAHRLALENDRIRADMVESSTFNHLAIKYNVTGVPKTVINETASIVGAQPITAFLDEIERI